MKKIFIFVFMFGVIFSNAAFAQTNNNTSEPILVATVNIHNAKIISQNDRDFVLSFDISNTIGVQSGVKYAVNLQKNGITVDQFVYSEELTISENSSINKVIKYTVPKTVASGEYTLAIDSRAKNNLPFAFYGLGKVFIKENSEKNIKIIPESCYTLVSDDASSTRKYSLSGGPTITSSSVVTLKCNVKSTFNSDMVFNTVIEIRKNSIFGDLVEQEKPLKQDVVFKTGDNLVSIVLPLGSVPHYYVNSIQFTSLDGKNSSNIITPSYFLVGEVGIIENIVFDKTFYRVGDNAKIQVYQTLGDVSTSSTKILSININNSNNISCNTKFIYEVPMGLPVFFIEVPIVNDCVNPKSEITLSKLDSNGHAIMLDSKKIDITTPTDLVPKDLLKNNYSVLFIITVLVLTSIILFILYRRKRLNLLKVSLFFFISLNFFFSISSSALADTYLLPELKYWWSGDDKQKVHYYFNVSFPQYTLPGQDINLSGSVSNNNTNSSVHPNFTYMSVKIDNDPSKSIGVGCYNNCATSNGKGFSGFSASGTHSLSIATYGYSCNKHTDAYCGNDGSSSWGKPLNVTSASYGLTFKVGVPSITIGAGKSYLKPGESTTLTWNATNADNCAITANSSPTSITPYMAPYYQSVYSPYWKNSHTHCYIDFGGQHCEEVIDAQGGCNCYVSVLAGYKLVPFTSGTLNIGPLNVDTTYDIACNTNGSPSGGSSVKVSRLPGIGVGPLKIGACNVTGWACDPSNLSTQLKINLSETIGGPIIQTGKTYLDSSQYNTDIIKACGTNNNHGFYITLPVNSPLRDGNNHSLFVSAIDIDSVGATTSNAVSTTTTVNCSNSTAVTSIIALPEQILKNSSSTIEWYSPLATFCKIIKGTVEVYSGPMVTGSLDSGLLTSNTTFYAKCSNTGGDLQQEQVTVGVYSVPKKSPYISADPNGIVWDGSDYSSCSVLKDGQVIYTGTEGYQSYTSVLGTQFTLKCSSPDDADSIVNTTTKISSVKASCFASQNDKTDKIYLGKKTKWNISLSGPGIIVSSLWKGDNISSDYVSAPVSLEKVYTTVGLKTVYINSKVILSDSSIVNIPCIATTTIKLDPGIGSGEI